MKDNTTTTTVAAQSAGVPLEDTPNTEPGPPHQGEGGLPVAGHVHQQQDCIHEQAQPLDQKGRLQYVDGCLGQAVHHQSHRGILQISPKYILKGKLQLNSREVGSHDLAFLQTSVKTRERSHHGDILHSE